MKVYENNLSFSSKIIITINHSQDAEGHLFIRSFRRFPQGANPERSLLIAAMGPHIDPKDLYLDTELFNDDTLKSHANIFHC